MTELIKQYKFEANKDMFDLAKTDLFKALQGQYLNKEFSIQQTSGGRDGDLGVERMSYDLFFGGSCNGFDGRLVGIYQTTLESCNGHYQTLSVLMQPNERRPFEGEINQLFDQLGFAPKHDYLKQGDHVVWNRTFKKWMDTIYVPEEKPFNRI